MVRAAFGGIFLATISPLPAQAPDKPQTAEKETAVDPKVAATLKDEINAQRMRVRQRIAIMNLRQIGLALFEYETDFGAYPDVKPGAFVKSSNGSDAKPSAVTANDCFYQLIAAKKFQDGRPFTWDPPAKKDANGEKTPDRIEKCDYSYLSGMTAAGDPRRPLVVAPLVKGKKIFDRKLLGGKAVLLTMDNSVQTVSIEEDGRVMIDGKDLFDPAQAFWNGKVPEVRWPK